MGGEGDLGPPFVRVVKRRTTANKKERRRTQSINNAYHDLKRIIPNVPMDTKLSKIKTLRLATAYISYLTRALETDDTPGTFKAELGSLSRKSSSSSSNSQQNIMNNRRFVELSKSKGAYGMAPTCLGFRTETGTSFSID
ncbi:hypothetical protein D910_01977 [Dendroctonus ponderosae]